MAYVLGQYNYNKASGGDAFATLITGGTVKRFNPSQETTVGGLTFHDECIVIDNGLSANNNYYFHGKIQCKAQPQIFQVKLLSVEPDGDGVKETSESKDQYLRTITIGGGEKNEFIDVEFIFSPMVNCNCILFTLQRESSDYQIEIRYPKILYQELSNIKNIIGITPMGIPNGTKFIKIGVQSRPGLMMCINNEEIRNSRSGIFEIKNGVMTVVFFSVVNGVQESGSELSDYITNLVDNIDWNTSDQYSYCFFDTEKEPREIDSFTLDYLYQERQAQQGG